MSGFSTHFVLGDSAAGTLGLANVPGRVVVCRDLFLEGPIQFRGAVPGELAAWLETRVAWWQQQPTIDDESLDAARQANRSFLDALCGAREGHNVIWCGDLLSEQLHACFLSFVFEALEVPEVELARPMPSEDEYVSIGGLDPISIKKTRARRISSGELADAAEVWRAFAGDDARQFAERAAWTESAYCDQVACAVERFPSRRDGLTYWERGLLKQIEARPDDSTAKAVGAMMMAGLDHTPDCPGDVVLFQRLLELAQGGLLAQNGDGRGIATTRFAITERGNDVLAGRASRLDVAPIDRWIGGCHLDSASGRVIYSEDLTVQA